MCTVNEHIQCEVCQALILISVLHVFLARTVSVVFVFKRVFFGRNLSVYSKWSCTVRIGQALVLISVLLFCSEYSKCIISITAPVSRTEFICVQ